MNNEQRNTAKLETFGHLTAALEGLALINAELEAQNRLDAAKRRQAGAELLTTILKQIEPHLPFLMGLTTRTIKTELPGLGEEYVAKGIAIRLLPLKGGRASLWLSCKADPNAIAPFWPLASLVVGSNDPNEITPEGALQAGFRATEIIEALAVYLKDRACGALQHNEELAEITERILLTSHVLWSNRK